MTAVFFISGVSPLAHCNGFIAGIQPFLVGGLIGTALGYVVSAPSAKKAQQEATDKA
jgi:hypothetical protein